LLFIFCQSECVTFRGRAADRRSERIIIGTRMGGLIKSLAG